MPYIIPLSSYLSSMSIHQNPIFVKRNFIEIEIWHAQFGQQL